MNERHERHLSSSQNQLGKHLRSFFGEDQPITSTIMANILLPYNLSNQRRSRENHHSFDGLFVPFHLPQMDHHMSQKFLWWHFAIILIVSWKTFHKPLNAIWMDTVALTGSFHACRLTWGRPTASNIIIPWGTASRSYHLCCTGIKAYFFFGQLQNNRTWLETAAVRTAASEPPFWSSLRLAID